MECLQLQRARRELQVQQPCALVGDCATLLARGLAHAHGALARAARDANPVWARELYLKFDDRGHFSEILRQSDLPDGVPNFVQDSISSSKKNILRGMHLQLNQWQLITLLEGQIVDVLINLDVDSINFLKSLSIELSWNMLNQVLVEPGFAHGFGVISDVAKIHYKAGFPETHFFKF